MENWQQEVLSLPRLFCFLNPWKEMAINQRMAHALLWKDSVREGWWSSDRGRKLRDCTSAWALMTPRGKEGERESRQKPGREVASASTKVRPAGVGAQVDDPCHAWWYWGKEYRKKKKWSHYGQAAKLLKSSRLRHEKIILVLMSPAT